MPVTSGATSTEANLNDTTPAAPAGSINVKFQASAPYVDPNDPNLQVRDISAYIPDSAISGQKFNAVTAGGTDSTFTLDAASTWPNTRWIVIKADSGAGKVLVHPQPGGDDIQGNAEYDLVNQYDRVELYSDGTNIFIIGSNT